MRKHLKHKSVTHIMQSQIVTRETIIKVEFSMQIHDWFIINRQGRDLEDLSDVIICICHDQQLVREL